ncbi:MAG: DUF2470 domain-containing protein [Cyanobacteriota bacterium]|nr:DUF2470 domain-containing protein [Cyanobacteriota bacterium]
MSEPITPEISTRICTHMNQDHSDAVLLYARLYGDCTDAESATMISIDPQGMKIEAATNGQVVPVRVEFDRELKDAEDAHHTLVEMLKQGRKTKTEK